MVGDSLRLQRIDGGQEHFMDNWAGYGIVTIEQCQIVWTIAKDLVTNFGIEMD
jgi:hypothetical protein